MPRTPTLLCILKTHIRTQGRTDFIFGQEGHAYFGGNTIAVNGPGWVTASGRQSDDSGSCAYPSRVCLHFAMFYPLCLSDVFNQNTIVLASGASNGTSGHVYFGRPWRSTSRLRIKYVRSTTNALTIHNILADYAKSVSSGILPKFPLLIFSTFQSHLQKYGRHSTS